MATKRIIRKPVESDFAELDHDILALAKVKADRAALEKREGELSAGIMQVLPKDGREVTDPLTGNIVACTKVEGTLLEIDQEGLRKDIGAPLWNRITTRVLDTTKLKALVAANDIKPTTLAKHSEEKPKKPYLRITRK